MLLDDSIINVGTVASSRYVTRIKSRVDELQRQLHLFNQTLVCFWLSLLYLRKRLTFATCNFVPIICFLPLLHRMSGLHAKEIGCTWRVSFWTKTLRGSCPLNPKCFLKWTNPGKRSWQGLTRCLMPLEQLHSLVSDFMSQKEILVKRLKPALRPPSFSTKICWRPLGATMPFWMRYKSVWRPILSLRELCSQGTSPC